MGQARDLSLVLASAAAGVCVCVCVCVKSGQMKCPFDRVLIDLHFLQAQGRKEGPGKGFSNRINEKRVDTLISIPIPT